MGCSDIFDSWREDQERHAKKRIQYYYDQLEKLSDEQAIAKVLAAICRRSGVDLSNLAAAVERRFGVHSPSLI